MGQPRPGQVPPLLKDVDIVVSERDHLRSCERASDPTAQGVDQTSVSFGTKFPNYGWLLFSQRCYDRPQESRLIDETVASGFGAQDMHGPESG